MTETLVIWLAVPRLTYCEGLLTYKVVYARKPARILASLKPVPRPSLLRLAFSQIVADKVVASIQAPTISQSSVFSLPTMHTRLTKRKAPNTVAQAHVTLVTVKIVTD